MIATCRPLALGALSALAIACVAPQPKGPGGWPDGGLLISPDLTPDPPRMGAAYGDQRLPAVAWGGNTYLLAWVDVPTGAVRAARLSADGTVLDPDGLGLDPEAIPGTVTTRPAAAFDGVTFLVAWATRDTGGQDRVLAARVGPDGRVLDAPPIVVRGPAIGPLVTREVGGVAFASGVYLVVWQDGYENLDIEAARVTPIGTVLDDTPLHIAESAASESAPSVTTDGARFLVAWERSPYPAPRPHEVRATRVTPQGQLVDVPELLVATSTDGGAGATGPLLAWDSVHFWVVWTQDGSSPDVYATRIDAQTGALLSPQVVAGAPGEAELAAAVVADGDGLRPLWWAPSARGLGLFGAWLSPTGAALGSPPKAELAFSAAPVLTQEVALALGDGQRLLAWSDGRGGRSRPLITFGSQPDLDVYAARLASTPPSHTTVLDPAGVRVSSSMNAQVAPAIASDGQHWLVVWADTRGGTYDLYGARLSAGGRWLDAPFVISAAADCQYGPAVAFDGQVWLVAWEDFRDDRSSRRRSIYAARVTREGAVLDPDGIPIALHVFATPTPPAVASGGSVFLVTWMEQRGLEQGNISGARVTASGQVLDTPPFTISIGANTSALAPSTLFDGTQFQVAWETYSGIYVARVRPDATVLDVPAGVLVARKAASINDLASHLGFAHDGERSLVVWKTFNLAAESRLLAARLGAEATPLDATPLILVEDFGVSSAHATYFDGATFRVAWEVNSDGQSDLVLGAVPGEGAALGAPVPLVRGPLDDVSPAVGPGPAGSATLVYSRFTHFPSGDVPRLQARVLPGDSSLRFTSAPEPLARCGETWRYASALDEPGDYRFELAAPDDQPLPDGLTVDEAGVVTWTPAADQRGEYALVLWALGADAAAGQPLAVTVHCEGLRFRRVAGCASAPTASSAGVALALWWLRRPRRR